MFGTGNESDSGSEGDSQPAASQQKASSQAWREEREEEGGEESSPSPQVEAKKGRKSRKETTKTAKVVYMCVRERERCKGARNYKVVVRLKIIIPLLHVLQPKKVKKAEVQMMYSDSQKLVRGEKIS